MKYRLVVLTFSLTEMRNISDIYIDDQMYLHNGPLGYASKMQYYCMDECKCYTDQYFLVQTLQLQELSCILLTGAERIQNHKHVAEVDR